MNLKNKSKLHRLILTLLMLATSFGSSLVFADDAVVVDDAGYVIEVGVDRDKENPLVIKLGDQAEFNIDKKFTPGTVVKRNIVFNNILTEEIQVTIAEIKDLQVEDDDVKYPLSDVLELTLTVEGSEIYKGLLKDTTTPVLNWLTVPAGGSLIISVELEMPLLVDNSYQGSESETLWSFSTRADVPDDPEEEEDDEFDYVEVDQNKDDESGDGSLDAGTGAEGADAGEAEASDPTPTGDIVAKGFASIVVVSGLGLVAYVLVKHVKKDN